MGASRRSPRLRLISSDSLDEVASAVPSSAVQSVAAEDSVDEQLVLRARGADMPPFESLERRHAAFAFNLAVRIQGSSADVEDVVHDAFLKAQECLSDLRDSAAF